VAEHQVTSPTNSLPLSLSPLADILALTAVFVAIGFLNATLGTATDGWALDLLLGENVSWQATCSSVGHIAGDFLGNAFVLLESREFCNQHLRPVFGWAAQNAGLIDIKGKLFVLRVPRAHLVLDEFKWVLLIRRPNGEFFYFEPFIGLLAK
jgi:hypothetical protein